MAGSISSARKRRSLEFAEEQTNVVAPLHSFESDGNKESRSRI